MDVLKQIALPQSPEHFQLLLLILNLTTAVLIPYMGFLLVSTFLARRGERESAGNGRAAVEARVFMDTAMPNRQLVAFLGIVPAFSLVFVTAQILQATEAIAVGLLLAGALCFLTASVLLYAYRVTFHVSGVVGGLLPFARQRPEAAQAVQAAEAFDIGARQTHARTGRWGFWLLFLSSLLVTGALSITTDPDAWNRIGSVFQLLLSPLFLLRYVQFLTLAVSVTGVFFLFFRGDDPVLRNRAWSLGMIALLAQPLALVAVTMALPPPALSGAVYALTGLAILLFFTTAIFLYAVRREQKPWETASAFASVVLAVVVLSTVDQVAIGNATRVHAARLAVAYERSTDDLKARLGIGAPAMTGEEIYAAKCSACHLFDQKKVGPPYKDVLPKYEGRKAALASFLLNPVKVNPAYPSMPAQGLKPAEADSIATYLLSKYPVTAGQNPGAEAAGSQENPR